MRQTVGVMLKSLKLTNRESSCIFIIQVLIRNTTLRSPLTQITYKSNVSVLLLPIFIGRTGMEFRPNNRLDIYDVKDKQWREASITEC